MRRCVQDFRSPAPPHEPSTLNTGGSLQVLLSESPVKRKGYAEPFYRRLVAKACPPQQKKYPGSLFTATSSGSANWRLHDRAGFPTSHVSKPHSTRAGEPFCRTSDKAPDNRTGEEFLTCCHLANQISTPLYGYAFSVHSLSGYSVDSLS